MRLELDNRLLTQNIVCWKGKKMNKRKGGNIVGCGNAYEYERNRYSSRSGEAIFGYSVRDD